MFFVNTIISNNDLKLKSSINNFFVKNNVGYILKQCNFFKKKRISCICVKRFIFTLVFTGKNLFRTLEFSSKIEVSKDNVYRFLNSSRFNWCKLLLMLSSSIIKKNIEPLTSEDRVNVLIIHDSLFSRNRSKHIELRIKYLKDFRLLTLGWSDGNTFLPLAFTLLCSEKKENRICTEINLLIKGKQKPYNL